MKTRPESGRSWADASDGLRARLEPAGLTQVLGSARWNGTGAGDWHDDHGNLPPAGTVPEGLQYAFAWDVKAAPDGTRDGRTPRWYPQGITTTFDGYGGPHPALGRNIVAVSWYGKNGYGERGARVSFLDVTADSPNPVYQHVLLVEPRQVRADSRPTYRPVEMHAGGMAWVGNFLYIANRPGQSTTSRRGGMSVFDITKMVKVTGGEAFRDRFGYRNGKYYAYGYHYVLPLHHIYENAGGSDFQHSQLSLDRTQAGGHSIVSSEYTTATSGRAARWNLANSGYIADGDPDEGWSLRTERVQGAVSVTSGAYYSANSRRAHPNDPPLPGQLWKQMPRGSAPRKHRRLAVGPEDLSYDPAHGGSVWALGEHPFQRRVYRVGLGE
ncbi:hypothetical protein ACWEPM_15715 [Streptomyces sp. NPDC004244]